ncbi:MAG: hypothetical protein JO316_17935 [Abitibacteriaceae bacterium]|nr:hypothetical protein [Abditibacteriaceae bacterium]MBV9867240.1 hypothetical protein [Abditibacteriaceae bacterium]
MKRIFVVSILCLFLKSLPANAWWPQGHSTLAAAALKALPDDVPGYFRNDPGQVAHCAQDPDVAKTPVLPFTTAHEDPEHYIDYELLKGKPLPSTRDAYYTMLVNMKLSPKEVGVVPYTVAEWTERLTITFAEQRKWPNNPYIQNKSLVYAGLLAHYAGDICMPLHVTNDYDGRANADGTSPHTGIHAKVDSLIEKVGLKPEDLARAQKIDVISPQVPAKWQALAEQMAQDKDQRRSIIRGLFPAVLDEMERSRTFINRTYALEPQLPPAQGDWTPSAEVIAFTTERGREATHFIATLYLTAWRRSAAIQLPKWLVRENEPANDGVAATVK